MSVPMEKEKRNRAMLYRDYKNISYHVIYIAPELVMTVLHNTLFPKRNFPEVVFLLGRSVD